MGGLAHILPSGPEHIFRLPEVSAPGVLWLCPSHPYSWNSVYSQPSLPLLLLVWNVVSIPHASTNVPCPERLRRCLLSLRGGLLFCPVPRAPSQCVLTEAVSMYYLMATLPHSVLPYIQAGPRSLPPEVCSELTLVDIQRMFK